MATLLCVGKQKHQPGGNSPGNLPWPHCSTGWTKLCDPQPSLGLVLRSLAQSTTRASAFLLYIGNQRVREWFGLQRTL